MASVFEKALPLVETEEGTDKICLNHDVLNQICSIKKQINAVAITGLLRTGKSYLLTRLAERYEGFPLGSSCEAKTKGIWVWCVDHPVCKGQVLMLLDTEGIGDPKKTNRNHDNQLCTLAILLCSTLIYNTFGVLDNDAFQKLSFVTEMSKNVKVSDSANSSDAEFDKYFPDLILVLRDFSLELKLNGKECSSDEYLEDAMTALEGDSEDIKRYNEPRLCIRKYFRSMKCFVFDRPIGRKSLSQLDSLTDADLSEDFVDEKEEFLSYIHNNASPMELTNGTPVTGSMFAHMATSYVTAIRDGAIPCIERALRNMAINENRKAVEEAFGIYQRGMVFAYPPDDYNTILDAHNHSKDQAFEHFLKHRVLDDDDSYKAKLDVMVLQEYERLKTKLVQDSTARCKESLITLHEEIAENIKNGVYSNPGGYNVYCSHRDILKRGYDVCPNLGVMKEDAYADFHHQMSTESDAILKGDQHLSEKEKELERANIERREAIERQSIVESRLQEFDQELKNMQRQQEKELSKLVNSYTNEMQRQREHFDKLNEKREGEIRRLEKENLSQLTEKHRSEQRAQEEAQRQRDNMMIDKIKKMEEQREEDQLKKVSKEKDEANLKERMQTLDQEIENMKSQLEKESKKLVKSHAEEILKNNRIKELEKKIAELEKPNKCTLC